MSTKMVKSKRFQGIYWRESDSASKVHNGRRDKCFYFRCRDAGNRDVWVKVGWASKGFTEQAANKKRQEALSDKKSAADNFSARKKFVLDAAFDLWKTWADGDGKHTAQEENRWKLHVKPKIGHLPLDAVTDETVAKLKVELLEKLSTQSTKHILSLIRRVFNFAVKSKKWRGLPPFGAHSICTMPKMKNESEACLSPTCPSP